MEHGTSGYRKGCRCDICKAANAAYQREYYKRNPKHADAVRERSRRNWAENKDVLREQRKEYRARNAEKIAAAKAKYRRENREKITDGLRKYRKTNKHVIDKYRAEWLKTENGQRSVNAILARRREVPYTDDALEYILLLKGDPCSYCGGPSREVDHIVPVISGGTGDWDNLAAACRSCNARKNDKSLLQFLLFESRMATI